MASSSVYKMKEIALREINGGHDESYKLLCQYVEMIKLTNPGSIAHCSGTYMGNPEKTLKFKSIFISFQAQFVGLIRGCRSLIGVDGAHLKGNHGGVLLSAVALDGNNEMFPVAIAVVEAENKDSWCSFFTFLKQCVAESGRTNWTIISDRQKGVEPTLDMVWPDAYRRFCARHLCKNFKQQYPGLLLYKLFWMVVNATSEYTFKRALEQVVQHGGNGCARWFLDLGDKEQWTKHKFDPELSCEDNTSNFVESFNSTLGVHKTNPVLSLLEGVRRMTMISGIPCKHAIRAILEAKRNPKDYVNDWFSVKRYKEAYGLSIHPIADKAQWPVFDVPYLEPPTLRRSIGRPSRNRRREPGEEQKKGKRSVTVKCTKCGCFGHNKKTCKGGYTAKQRQELQGKFSKKPAHQGLTKASTSNFASLNDLETIIMGSASTSTQPQEKGGTQKADVKEWRKIKVKRI
ncbi:uncharacterized protein LOC141651926 [Silene latifolia]|uniref:uncharacterized protein LOC141651926 n=1 Tax=Silene latifolia TaxID=37657 RepID=UPI003D787A56